MFPSGSLKVTDFFNTVFGGDIGGDGSGETAVLVRFAFLFLGLPLELSLMGC